jgi:hypothetical protein
MDLHTLAANPMRAYFMRRPSIAAQHHFLHRDVCCQVSTLGGRDCANSVEAL